MPPPTAVRAPTHAKYHDTIDEDVDMLDRPVDKDETERKLEKLLFGDEEGFLDALQTSRQRTPCAAGRR